jgi:hypothetical protein
VRHLAIVVLILVCVALTVREGSAQTCFGTAPVDASLPFHLGGGVAFSENRTGYAGAVTGGGDSFFGQVGLGGIFHDDLDASATSLSFAGGAQVAADSDRRVVICPNAGVTKTFGPNDIGGSGLNLSTLGIDGGVAVGWIAAVSGRVALVPTVGMSVVRLRTTSTFRGESDSESDTLGRLSLGAGIVLSERFSIGPGVVIPFGLEDAETVFLLGVGISLAP